MADINTKNSQNISGKYYVDENCIACDACTLAAPENFAMNDEEGFAYVKKQPENESEEEKCKESLESCPVEAIGDDGE